MPIITARSPSRTTAAKKAPGRLAHAVRGDRKISDAIAKIKLLGSGIGASAIDAGTWVKAIVLIRPDAVGNGRSKKV